mmetsp:Transcript_68169/g.176912  ORF Transcript_68169/g.176912 Transcript_68169/m.176912 type:complete len:236 (+) Transcript_68169:3-710(+)
MAKLHQKRGPRALRKSYKLHPVAFHFKPLQQQRRTPLGFHAEVARTGVGTPAITDKPSTTPLAAAPEKQSSRTTECATPRGVIDSLACGAMGSDGCRQTEPTGISAVVSCAERVGKPACATSSDRTAPKTSSAVIGPIWNSLNASSSASKLAVARSHVSCAIRTSSWAASTAPSASHSSISAARSRSALKDCRCWAVAKHASAEATASARWIAPSGVDAASSPKALACLTSSARN